MASTDHISELAALTASELIDGYRQKDFTPSEVFAAIQDRIDQHNPEINAFYVREHAAAERAADQSTARWTAGRANTALDGVPITLKENLATVGTPSPAGTAARADAAPATEDGPVAELLSAAGAVRLGKTVMPEFGMLTSGVSSLHGVTRNPWNLDWTVGGSSAGSSAAAAARFGPIHIGTDIGGSVRLPANWTGLAALKPTYAIVPVDVPYIGRHVGPLARTIDDLARAMQVIAQPDERYRDYTYQERPADWGAVASSPYDESDIAKLRVAIHTDAGCGLPTDPEIRAVIHSVGKAFEEAGACVEEIDPIMTPHQFEMLCLFFRARAWREVKNLSRSSREAALPYFVQWALGAADLSATELLNAYDTVQAMRGAVIQATRSYDVILSPVAPVAAFPADWCGPTNDPATALHDIVYTVPYNFSEQPAASVNAGFTADGRPVGAQFAGRRFDDVRLLQIARWFEQARPATAVPVWPR
jgi:aspartyl-tRNA(Asn)/glutamyl-tRNA(Gln) amidotransferase subunit A